jgi:putative hydrolase of the HAD superfamily
MRERIRLSGLVDRFESGQIEPRAFVDELTAALGIDPGYDEFCRIWSSVFLPDTLIPEEFVVTLKQNYPVLLLSNTNALHFEMIATNYPILRHFDDYILSYKVGAMKPSPQIYEAAVKRAGVAPAECFFTDDIPAYVQGARDYGIDAAVFEGYAKLRQDLADRGVVF